MFSIFRLVKFLDPIDITIDTDGLLNNYAANAAPTVNDDTGAGYSVGSKWVDITGDEAYIAVDVTAAAAVWEKITPLTGHAFTSTDNAVPKFDSTEGDLQNTGILISDTNEVTVESGISFNKMILINM